MLIKDIHQKAVVWLVALLFVLLPVQTAALNEISPMLTGEPTSPIIITEVQTGSSSAGKGDEFIELYNTSSDEVDITGWQVRYLNAATDQSAVPSIITEVMTQGGSPLLLAPNEYFVLHTESVVLPVGIRGQTYTARLSSADKSIALFAPDATICQFVVQDAIAWGASLKAEGEAVSVADTSERVLQRRQNVSNIYVDTDNNKHDFGLFVATAAPGGHTALTATPGMANSSAIISDSLLPEYMSRPTFTALVIEGCVIPAPPEQSVEPGSVEPAEGTDVTPDSGGEPLPAVPPVESLAPPPVITELLPNPGSPQTDAEDEFIELYNPGDMPFDLSHFIFEAGTTTKRRYTIPEGVMLPAKTYRAFYSGDTHLNLSNTSGQVALLNEEGEVVSLTEPYVVAKDGQAWVLLDGEWSWSSLPTPNAINVAGVVLAAKTVTKKAASPATPKPKTSSPGKTATKKTSTPATAKKIPSVHTIASVQPSFSIHAYTLALVGVSALLYGAYEYRADLANRIHQFRNYRAARRSARKSAHGR